MMTIFYAIGKILRSFWRAVTTLRQVVFNLIFLFFIFLIVVVLVTSMVKSVPKDVALIIAPSGKIVEQATESLLIDRLFDAAPSTETVLRDIIDTIDHARFDNNIRVMVLELENLGQVGVSQLQEIGAAITRFKDSGKAVIAYGTSFNQQQYYLAAHADKLYLHPMGQIWLSGFGVYRHYVKGALDKLRIDFHVFIKGTYKSALEPFMRPDMSQADRESLTDWLTSLWGAYSTEIEALRGLPENFINDLIDNLDTHLREVDGDAAQMALALRLVDGLKTVDEVRAELVQLVGEDEDGSGYRSVRFGEYAETVLPLVRRIQPGQDRVAVIVAEGIIMDGRQPSGRIGATSLTDIIRQVRDDERVKALVLRINSGGGSALASEIIRRELELTRIVGKPVVVSMSSIAASGAYWISVAADEIWAIPTTITGSIGIFAALPTFDRSLETIGVTSDGVGTTRLSGAFTLTRPLNPLLSEVLEQEISQGYERFIARVGTGRQMSVDDVEKVAQGRVWAATAALNLGLIDKLGGLAEAIQSAARLAGLDAYGVVYAEKPVTVRERLLRRIKRLAAQSLGEHQPPVEISAVRRFLPGLIDPELNAILQLNDPGHTYALCLPCLALEN